jgi:hypothetical protein
MGVQLRPHKVLGAIVDGKELHALCLTSGDFSFIVFSYKDVKFEEDQEKQKLVIKFEYDVHEVPESRKGYDKSAFEKELGDFLVELLYYGLEKDYPLGVVDAKD